MYPMVPIATEVPLLHLNGIIYHILWSAENIANLVTVRVMHCADMR